MFDKIDFQEVSGEMAIWRVKHCDNQSSHFCPLVSHCALSGLDDSVLSALLATRGVGLQAKLFPVTGNPPGPVMPRLVTGEKTPGRTRGHNMNYKVPRFNPVVQDISSWQRGHCHVSRRHDLIIPWRSWEIRCVSDVGQMMKNNRSSRDSNMIINLILELKDVIFNVSQHTEHSNQTSQIL